MMLTIVAYLIMGIAIRLARQSACWITDGFYARVAVFSLVVGGSVTLGLLMQAIVHGGL